MANLNLLLGLLVNQQQRRALANLRSEGMTELKAEWRGPVALERAPESGN